jgi:hypothetical protein
MKLFTCLTGVNGDFLKAPVSSSFFLFQGVFPGLSQRWDAAEL